MQNNTFIRSLQSTSIFGMPFDFVKMNTDSNNDMHICNKVIKLCNEYEKDCIAKYIVTVNMDFVHKSFSFFPSFQNCIEQKHLLEIICSSDLVIADGMPIVWLSKLTGNALPERVTGADIVPALAKLSSEIHEKSVFDKKLKSKNELRLYFLGGGKGVAQKAVDNLKKMYPYMNVAGISSPEITIQPISTKELHDNNMSEIDVNIIKNINESNADILFLALGNPKQEFWFHKYRHILKVGVAIGVGGALEFLAGNTVRAPLWMQRLGLEWLWRLQQEPLRLYNRYFIGGVKLVTLGIPMLVGQWLCWLYSRCVHCTQLSSLYEPAILAGNPFISPFFSVFLSDINKNELKKEIINKKMIQEIEDNQKKYFITFVTPQVINTDYFLSINEEMEQIKQDFHEGKKAIQLCFDMSNTVYADTISISILIKLLYWLNKISEQTQYKKKYHNNNECQPLQIKNLRYSMRILLKASGAYASLRKAIV